MISEREKEVLENISRGFTAKEIANKLFLSCHTIISHRKSLYLKLEATNSAQLVYQGIKHGYIQIEEY